MFVSAFRLIIKVNTALLSDRFLHIIARIYSKHWKVIHQITQRLCLYRRLFIAILRNKLHWLLSVLKLKTRFYTRTQIIQYDHNLCYDGCTFTIIVVYCLFFNVVSILAGSASTMGIRRMRFNDKSTGEETGQRKVEASPEMVKQCNIWYSYIYDSWQRITIIENKQLYHFQPRDCKV